MNYFLAAYILIWLLLLVYTAYINQRLTRLQQKTDLLESIVEEKKAK